MVGELARWTLVLGVCLRLGVGVVVGPVYSNDYAGLDYNVTDWHSDPAQGANHYESAALACARYCEADAECCAWTYCPPAPNDPERCCLKYAVPSLQVGAPHWTGLPSRAYNNASGHPVVTAMCQHRDPPYPGPAQWQPRLHNMPACLNVESWHDIAAAITVEGIHHVFQGCPGDGGWHHASSTDLVHWTNHGISVTQRNESYAGFTSDDSPCSGFAVADDDGSLYVGFRQCSSTTGVQGGHPWDVPLELRRATNSSLLSFGANLYLYNVSFYRALPYDPVRPWKDTDGMWYSTIATDGCNGTSRALPCAAGGQLDLWRSPTLLGHAQPGANAGWQHVGAMFTSNRTVLSALHPDLIEPQELVTVDYIGGLPGDPAQGGTRLLLNNVNGNAGVGTTMFFRGHQPTPGGRFVSLHNDTDFAAAGDVGMLDWGAFCLNVSGTDKPGLVGLALLRGDCSRGFSMARTLGAGASNQVLLPGRRVLVGWVGLTPAAQSLPRDLTLGPGFEVLQQFVPELEALRTPAIVSPVQLEVVATLTVPAMSQHGSWRSNTTAGVQLLDDGNGGFGVTVGFDFGRELVFVDATRAGNSDVRAGPLLTPVTGDPSTCRLHLILDHNLLTVIFNNQTALTVILEPDDKFLAGGLGAWSDDPALLPVVTSWYLDLAS
ncbi:uncharacterized protein MONBRDRAFT_5591 [Monosiga brevicollis MX1]|uniref:Glycosyl hydrolase family 32 C-terminal domain-containing protein n=1 Tax=Monosiga brevicollis TaxID=81824 RepID=A9URW5_MONBE|nr:uncharacterized protein MONBRDRAFT_5591 [Monosiga brevicollis MX1]EDQ91676.1 predicted protein [Monosiga brevicollis MX1]|eukprot:XP_001742962.1 hypothetical protein [Monosiga brevicollis MX1]